MTTYETYLREQVNGRGVRTKACPRCGGEGRVDFDDSPRLHTCPVCVGRRIVRAYECDTCEDTGVYERDHNFGTDTVAYDAPMLHYCDDCETGAFAEEQGVLDVEPWGMPKDEQWLEEMRAVARGEAL